MPKFTTTFKPPAPKAAKPPIPTKPQPITVDLPTERSTPVEDINRYHFLIHGEKKIGKTTLATAQDGVLLLTFDPLQLAYSLYQRHVPTWAHWMAYLVKLESIPYDQFPYTRIVVDGADIWYRRCQTWVCKKLGITHPKDAPWGKGWDMLKETFSESLERLLALPCGSWFISHSAWREVETREKDRKIEKLVPLIKGGGEEILNGKMNGWFAYDYVGQDRVLVILGDERVGAGHNIKNHFLTPSGERVREIPMGADEGEAYANLVNAFNNQQTFAELAKGGIQRKQPHIARGNNTQPVKYSVRKIG